MHNRIGIIIGNIAGNQSISLFIVSMLCVSDI